MLTELPLHTSSCGSPVFDLSPRMNHLNTSLSNFQVINKEDNNNNHSIWDITNSPTEEGITEEEFFEFTRQMNETNEINSMVTNYLQNAPNRIRNRGETQLPNIGEEFQNRFHQKDPINNFKDFLKLIDDQTWYECDQFFFF